MHLMSCTQATTHLQLLSCVHEEGEKQASKHNQPPLNGFASAETRETQIWQIHADVADKDLLWKYKSEMEIQVFGFVCFFCFFLTSCMKHFSKSPSAFDSSLHDNLLGHEHRWALLLVASLTDPLKQPRQEFNLWLSHHRCYVSLICWRLQEWFNFMLPVLGNYLPLKINKNKITVRNVQ